MLTYRVPLHLVLSLLLLAVALAVGPGRASCAGPREIRATVTVNMSSSDNLPGQPGDFESFYVSGDRPMPKGVSSTTRLRGGLLGSAWCHYHLRSHDVRANLDVDVYQYAPNGPLSAHIICPHCAARGHVGQDQDHAIWIKQESGKAIEFELLPPDRPWPFVFPGWAPEAMRREFPEGLGGILSTGPFRCTFPVHPSQTLIVGATVCDFRAVIERNVVRRVDAGTKG